MGKAMRDPGLKGLRNFALVTGAMFAAIFGVLLPWLFGKHLPLWPWMLFAVLSIWGLAHPASLKPVYTAWMKVANAIGRVNNYLLLGLIFFIMITPIGLARRLMGRDPMRRRLQRDLATYREPKSKRSRDSMERPF